MTNGLERFHLDVLRGRTAHPSRPVDRDEFLLGSGPDCHLRLGDDDVSERHALLRFADGGLRIERLADAPALLVNGEEIVAATLEDGDIVSIGRFEFVLRDEAIDTASEPAELTAAELVDLLESEMEAVETFEAGRAAGADDLLERVESDRNEHPQVSELLDRLEAFTAELDQRAERLAEREAQLLAVSEELLGMHEELARRVAALESLTSTPLRRAA